MGSFMTKENTNLVRFGAVLAIMITGTFAIGTTLEGHDWSFVGKQTMWVALFSFGLAAASVGVVIAAEWLINKWRTRK